MYRCLFICLVGLVSCLLETGCGEGDHSPSASDRQEQALRDPFGYSPDLTKNSQTVTGNGDKDAFKRDVDHVFNP